MCVLQQQCCIFHFPTIPGQPAWWKAKNQFLRTQRKETGGAERHLWRGCILSVFCILSLLCWSVQCLNSFSIICCCICHMSAVTIRMQQHGVQGKFIKCCSPLWCDSVQRLYTLCAMVTGFRLRLFAPISVSFSAFHLFKCVCVKFMITSAGTKETWV